MRLTPGGLLPRGRPGEAEADAVPGARVRVLPGRHFPAFASGDVGVVAVVDADARTCDVVFGGRDARPVTVALRHLRVVEPGDEPRGPAGDPTPQASPRTRDSDRNRGASGAGALPGPAGGPTPQVSPRTPRAAACLAPSAVAGSAPCEADSLAPKVASLEATSASLQRAVQDLEARVAAWEASEAVAAEGAAAEAGRLAASRASALELEGAHQAEVSELRRSLDEALTLGRERDALQRQRRTSLRELEEQLEEVDARAAALRESSQVLAASVEEAARNVEKLGSRLGGQERRAASLEEVIGATGGGLARLTGLLEKQERRAADLGHAISSASEGVGRVAGLTEAQALRVQDLERRREALGSSGRSGGGDAPPAMGREERERIWQALRELQELVVHESEHRAAGLREVLGVLGQGLEQARSEHARQLADVEGRGRADGRRAKEWMRDAEARHLEYERRAEALDRRLDALSQGKGGAAARGARAEPAEAAAHGGCSPRFSPRSGGGATPRGAPEEATATQMATSEAMHRLEALESRFDRSGASLEASRSPRGGAAATATQGTLGRLRGQLDALRSGLSGGGGGAAPSAAAPEIPAAEATSLSPRGQHAPAPQAHGWPAAPAMPTPVLQAASLSPRGPQAPGPQAHGWPAVPAPALQAQVLRCYSSPPVPAPQGAGHPVAAQTYPLEGLPRLGASVVPAVGRIAHAADPQPQSAVGLDLNRDGVAMAPAGLWSGGLTVRTGPAKVSGSPWHGGPEPGAGAAPQDC